VHGSDAVLPLRIFPRTGWSVSALGYGMWGMGGWTGTDEREAALALDRAVDLGCNFFDTALAYGEGRSERLLGALLRRRPGLELHVATKVPPKDRVWPGKASTPAADVFPYDHIVSCTKTSLDNLGIAQLDLQQLHVWDDAWSADDGWKRAAERLKSQGLIAAFGISVNRWQPENVLAAIRTGLVDSVQVVYNIFDQAPEDVLFPECERLGVAVIARVPLDEGSLTGTLTRDTRWPEGDWRNTYFASPNLNDTLHRIDALAPVASGAGLALPALALQFVLAHPTVTTTIPGMRRVRHVEGNVAAVTGTLDEATMRALRGHRWNRVPDARP
jgi:aryl-alcohol dehydrogenase-like predicted oxidoreductase